MSTINKTQLRQPRIAEMIANALRERILSGDLEDGGELPKQEDLIEEFRVSMPSIREAYRILETEGLITVRRGNRGGAVVHRPRAETAAYMLGLVLQSEGVTLGELALALRQFEPLCAGMCAARHDRAEVVVPVLESLHRAAEDALEGGPEFVQALREFHESIGALVGNDAVRLMLGTLERVWSNHEEAWATLAGEKGSLPDREIRLRSLREHREILDAIRDGDVQRATQLQREHLEHAQPFIVSSGDENKIVVAKSPGWR